MAGILNRDLIRPWMDLEYGPQKHYPRLKIERPEHEDLTALSNALKALVPIGLKVKTKQILDKFGLEEPGANDEILGQVAANPPNTANPTDPTSLNSILYRAGSKIKRGQASERVSTALAAQQPSVGEFEPQDVSEVLADRLQGEAAPAILSMLKTVEAMLQAATSLSEFEAMLLTAYPDLDDADLVDVMASALTAAHAGGRTALEQDSG